MTQCIIGKRLQPLAASFPKSVGLFVWQCWQKVGIFLVTCQWHLPKQSIHGQSRIRRTTRQIDFDDEHDKRNARMSYLTLEKTR